MAAPACTISDTAGDYSSEVGWGAGGYSSSGGISLYESQPSYQQGLVIHSGSQIIDQNNHRAVPDVSFDADPDTAPAMYSSYGNPASPWSFAGGTGFASSVWAGLVAIADEMRVNHGLGTLDGATQTLPKLYSIYNNPIEYAADFHDITSGSNGLYSAAVGYDLVTGLGSPQANNLIFDLAGVTATPAVTSIDPTSGPPTGGTLVTIAGSGFTGATAVYFGATPAANFTVDSDTEITATSPQGLGIVDVIVTTPGGTSATSPDDQFTYQLTLTVNTLVDKLDANINPADLSLREALSLTNANVGGDNTIYFDSSIDGGTIKLSLGELAITDSVNIEGLGSNLTIDAGGTSRIFNINDGNSGNVSNVNISGLTLTGGNAKDGGAIYSTESLGLGFVNVTGDTASDKGGGIYAVTPGTIDVAFCTISENSAVNSGGGIYTDVSDEMGGMDVSFSTVANNTASDGAGLYSQGNGFFQTYVYSSTISGNNASGSGGGIYSDTTDNAGETDIWYSTVSDNTATDGAGVFCNDSGQTVVQYSTISGNTARGFGGGLFVTSSLGMQFEYSTASGNYAVQGGGILTATPSGGTTLIQDSTIAENRAVGSGGGLNVANLGTTTIQNSTISGNIADVNSGGQGKGGGIYSANNSG